MKKPMQRDPHLPPSEVCNWLLAQEWSEPATVRIEDDNGETQIYKCCTSTAELGRDNDLDIAITADALAMLRADAAARYVRSLNA